MTRYMLSIMQPDGRAPEPEVLEPIMARLAALNADLQSADAFVFTAALHPATTATVVHAKGDEVLMTDGPYLEGKEHVGGFWLIEAPDLDAALQWATRATRATTLPIEVRPVAG